VYVLNWIEDLPLYRYGKLQVLIFSAFFIPLTRWFDKKIVWVLHNKYSHSIQRNFWTNWMFTLMMKNANLILTHSQEGIEFGREKYPRYAHKIKYHMIPLAPLFPASAPVEKQYDLFIWGTIQPYKGVLEFVQFLNASGNPEQIKVLIIGRCFDVQYKQQLQENLNEQVIFDDSFYEMEAILRFAQQSKYILFTYKPNSVLSSSALMDAIRMRTRIIGPHFGAFKDLQGWGLVKTYTQYEDILRLVQEHQPLSAEDHAKIDNFYQCHNWEQFAETLKTDLSELFPAAQS
jgi:hypothetical protein